MSELKPCPFCGGKAEWDEGEQRVYCTSCGCMPGTYDLPLDHESDVMPGVQVWNTRTDARADRLEKLLRLSRDELQFYVEYLPLRQCSADSEMIVKRIDAELGA